MENEVLQAVENPLSHALRRASSPRGRAKGDDVGIDPYEAPPGACEGVGGDTRHVARKLLHRVEQVLDSTEPLNPQAMKHISGILKDVRDILAVREDAVDSGVVTVTMDKEMEQFAQ